MHPVQYADEQCRASAQGRHYRPLNNQKVDGQPQNAAENFNRRNQQRFIHIVKPIGLLNGFRIIKPPEPTQRTGKQN